MSDAPTQDDVQVRNQPTVVEGRYVHPSWQVEFCTVPRLLRMHCPTLPEEQGVLVSQVSRRGPAAMFYDLLVGDVVLTADGKPVFGMASLPNFPGADLTVLRGGEVIAIEAREVCPPVATVDPLRTPLPQGSPLGASATAYSAGNESVSVAQNGDQITLEMSLPELHSVPIRFRGTREQITKDVQESKLSPAARQRVLQAIR